MAAVVDLLDSSGSELEQDTSKDDSSKPNYDCDEHPSTSEASCKRRKMGSVSSAIAVAPNSPVMPSAQCKFRWSMVPAAFNPVRLRHNGQERVLSDAELSKRAPATFRRRVLPKDLADTLLAQLLSDSTSWQSQDWVVHGQRHATPRTSAEYWLRVDHTPSTKDDSTRFRGQPSCEMREVATLMETFVKETRPWSQWRPSLALGNRYSTGQDTVGWHSDFLSSLGPRPVIVGLSLGATRIFRLRHEGSKTVVTIPMPHNSAVVMWDDCQEDWQHSVPRVADSSIGRHAVAGTVRLSLTFRMARPELDAKRSCCHCGRPSILKCKNGTYYLACSPMGSTKQCGFWESCAWAQTEANRLRDELFENTAVHENSTRSLPGSIDVIPSDASNLGIAGGTLERPVIDLC